MIDPRAHLGRDSAVAFALLCEADARTGLRELAAGFPERVMRKEKVVATGIDWTRVTESLSRELGPADDSRDGLWWKLPAGFLHVRASNTEPILRVVVESASDRDAREVAGRVREAIE